MLIQHNTEQGELIAALRAEAAGAKACFREISIQAIGLAVLATGGFLYAYQSGNPAPSIGAAGVFFVLLAVQRIGVHKFSTANRLLGYQLHLERLNPADAHLANIGWEEAFRAWRIVQSTVFAAIYRTPKGRFTKSPLVSDFSPPPMYSHSDEYREKVSKMLMFIQGQAGTASTAPLPPSVALGKHAVWWMQAERAVLGHGQYHAGSYLKRMFGLLTFAQFCCLVPLYLLAIERAVKGPMWPWGCFALFLILVLVPMCVLNALSLRRRRRILERELLSIHSCAIMWKAVALAHDLAWNRASPVEKHLYTERLAAIGRVFGTDACRLRELTDASALTWPDLERFRAESLRPS